MQRLELLLGEAVINLEQLKELVFHGEEDLFTVHKTWQVTGVRDCVVIFAFIVIYRASGRRECKTFGNY